MRTSPDVVGTEFTIAIQTVTGDLWRTVKGTAHLACVNVKQWMDFTRNVEALCDEFIRAISVIVTRLRKSYWPLATLSLQRLMRQRACHPSYATLDQYRP